MKVRHTKMVLLVMASSCVLLGGCGGQRIASGQDGLSEPSVQVKAEAVQDNLPGEAIGSKELNDGEMVYDYQVGMEPIPREIADLGGPCQGTVHAFPTRIQAGLSERSIMEDSKLEAEVIKRTNEVTEYLEETFSGRYQSDGVYIVNDCVWFFYYTDLDNDYPFSVTYLNNEYAGNSSPNQIMVSDYGKSEGVLEMEEKIQTIINRYFDSGCSRTWLQMEGIHISISIAQFTDSEVDRVEEQKKVIQMWDELQEYNNASAYVLNIDYYPEAYSEVIRDKYENGNVSDVIQGYNEDGIKMLMEQGELKECMHYTLGDLEGKYLYLLDVLEQYRNDSYEEEVIWPYWTEK